MPNSEQEMRATAKELEECIGTDEDMLSGRILGVRFNVGRAIEILTRFATLERAEARRAQLEEVIEIAENEKMDKETIYNLAISHVIAALRAKLTPAPEAEKGNDNAS